MIVLIFILIGILVGLIGPWHVPMQASPYIAIMILASIDSVFGGLTSISKKTFNMQVFLSGFIGNSVLAALLTFIGKKLDVDLYLVALIVFGTRLFTNFSIIRRYYIDLWREKLKK